MDKESPTNSSLGDWELLAKTPDQKDEPTTDNEQSENSGVEEVKICHLSIPKLSADGEISDGISVISEDELDECHANEQQNIDWHKEELQIGHQRKKPKKEETLPLTPPSTPPISDDSDNKQIQTLGPTEIQTVTDSTDPSPINFKKLLLFGGLATMICAILINNYQLNSLKAAHGGVGFNNEHEQRITELEIEKDILRDELERLKETLQVEDQPSALPSPNRKRQPPVSRQRQQQLNDQKIVWSGQEDDPLVIPDSMNILPDFCTKTFSENEDLYDEYNQVLCEKIWRKIEERTRNTNNFKKFNKELNKLRQGSEGPGEIFVELANEEEVRTEEPAKTDEKPDKKEKKRLNKEEYEQYQRQKEAKQQQKTSTTDGPKTRMTKEEYEQMKREKYQHQQHPDEPKKQVTKEEYERYQREKQAKPQQQHTEKPKDRLTKEEYEQLKREKYQKQQKYEEEKRDNKKYDRDETSSGAQAHKHHNKNEHSDKKRQYTAEEQRAYHEMKQKQQKNYRVKDGSGEHIKEKKRNRKDSEEDNDNSHEWHGKRMDSRERARQNKKKDENWYLERGNDREHHRDNSGEKKKNWYLDRANEREVARTVDDKNYQKHI